MKDARVLLGVFLVALILSGSNNARTAACDYWAANNGSGNGLAVGTPFTIQAFFQLGQATIQGKTLCLADGTYQGAANMVSPATFAPGLSGTQALPITIRAINDGGPLIDGQFVRRSFYLLGNKWFVIEGFNVKNTIGNTAATGSDGLIVRRMGFWDAIVNDNVGPLAVTGSGTQAAPILIEDVFIFGTGRKMFTPSQGGNYVTLRRVWIRGEGTINSGPRTMTTTYNNYNFTCENCLVTTSGESMPQNYSGYAGGALDGNTYTDFKWPTSADSNLGIDREDASACCVVGQGQCSGNGIFGSFAYVKSNALVGTDNNNPPTPTPANGWRTALVNRTDCFTINHLIAYLSPSHPQFASANRQVLFLGARNNGTAVTNSSASNLTTIANSNNIAAAWSVTNHVTATSLGALPGSANPWTGTTGAQLCYQWVNRQVTTTPLWPWPMNDRIKAATASAGAYPLAFCPTCTGTAPRTRTETDVTAEVESLLGTIPAACRTVSAPATIAVAPTFLNFNAVAGGSNPAAQTLEVTNIGGGTATWTRTHNGAPFGLSVQPAGGTAPTTLTATVNTSGVAAGSHPILLSVIGDGAAGTVQVPITITLTEPSPILQVTPGSLNFTGGANGPSPASEILSIENVGSGTLTWTVISDAAWLTAGQSNGTGNAFVAVTATPGALAPAIYNGTLTVSAAGATGSPIAVPVTFTVLPITSPAHQRGGRIR